MGLATLKDSRSAVVKDPSILKFSQAVLSAKLSATTASPPLAFIKEAVPVFVASVLAVSFYSTYYIVKYVRTGIEWEENRKSLRKALFLGAIIAGWFFSIAFVGMLAPHTVLALAVPLLLAIAFLGFEKGIRHRYFLKHVALKKLDEDEVIAMEFLDKESGEAVVLVYRVRGDMEAQTVRPQGLKADTEYRVVDPFDGPETGTISSKQLMEQGLDIRLAEESAEVRHLIPN